MIYWVDAQLPPQLASWLKQTFNVEAYALRDLGLRDAEDGYIFQKARQQCIVIISKDSDFVEMILRLGVPPQLLWVTCGNVTNRRLQNLLTQEPLAKLSNGKRSTLIKTPNKSAF